MSWDPELYGRFRAERERPFHDLLARVPTRERRLVYDLGCGTGRGTSLLAVTYPAAKVVGVDRSVAMLEHERNPVPNLRFLRGDLRALPLRGKAHLIVSNAVLHWLRDHERLLPKIVRLLAPRGWLAVQMPANHDAPSHTAVMEVAADPRWADRAPQSLAPGSVLSAERYVEILRRLGVRAQAWDHVYQHELPGVDAIYEWLSGTTLSGLLPRLDKVERAAFRADVLSRLRDAYGAGPRVGFPFRRRFVVGERTT